MSEGYLLYTSVTLLAMGIAALVLSVFFRLRSKKLVAVTDSLNATVFDQTFVVFDPYPQNKRVIHRFLGALPFVGFGLAFTGIAIVWKMLTSGLLLILFIIILGLNVMVTEEAPELYLNSKLFIQAIQNNTDLAQGDLKVIELMKKLGPTMSRYYFGLSTIFILASIALPYVWESLPSFIDWFVASVSRVSGLDGVAILQVAGVLVMVNLALLQFVASKLKNRIFRYEAK